MRIRKAFRPLALATALLLPTACSRPATPPPTAEPTTTTPMTMERSTPTALPTATKTPQSALTPTPQLTPIPTSALVEGWLVYENDFYGYAFSYPPDAKISTQGVTGIPSGEWPAGMTFEERMAQLRETYPSDICVTLNYGEGFIAFQPPWEEGGKYAAPCGVTGVGDYDVLSKTETIMIGERTYSATGWELRQRDSGAFHREFFMIDLEDSMRVDFGGSGDTYQDYLHTKDTLLQILETYRSTRSTIFTPSERRIPSATPDLSEMDVREWSSTSPDGTWAAQGLAAFPESGEGDRHHAG